jgi:lysophospholipase L1-like esterase
MIATCGLWLAKLELSRTLPTNKALPDHGHAYYLAREFVDQVALPDSGILLRLVSDDMQNNSKSNLILTEDGIPLGPAHASHANIRAAGDGRYSHWDGALYFSASDNSDVRTNGRVYQFRALLTVQRWVEDSTAIAIVIGLCSLPILIVGSKKRSAGSTILGVALIGGATLTAGNLFIALAALGFLAAVGGAISMGREPSFGRTRAKLEKSEKSEIAPSKSELARSKSEKTARTMRHPIVLLASVALAAAGLAAMINLSGVAFVFGAGLVVCGLLVLLNAAVGWTHESLGQRLQSSWMVDAVVVVVSITVAVACVEAYLARAESGATTKARDVPLSAEAAAAMAARQGVMTMPKEWERRVVQVPGAAHAYYWHDVLHVFDENNFRRAAPFPPKQQGVMRIMIIGDSMTYGTGVEQKWTFPSTLQTMLEPEYRVEVIPLGNEGAQTEDILKNLRRFLPRLAPDLVIYAVCQNDFLNSGEGQVQGNNYEFPIPKSWKTFLNKRTRVTRYLEDGYDTFLRRLRLRLDFYQDILKDTQGYQQRFARDVKAMNDFVLANGLPPIMAMVLDQFPNLNGPGYQTTLTAEKYLRAGGINVIDTGLYYQRYDKRVMMVSRWEGHPNEEAHAIFAAMLRAGLQQQPILASYRKQ